MRFTAILLLVWAQAQAEMELVIPPSLRRLQESDGICDVNNDADIDCDDPNNPISDGICDPVAEDDIDCVDEGGDQGDVVIDEEEADSSSSDSNDEEEPERTCSDAKSDLRELKR